MSWNKRNNTPHKFMYEMKNTKYYIVIHSSLYRPHLSKLPSGHQFGTFNCRKKL